MHLAIALLGMSLVLAESGQSQTSGNSSPAAPETPSQVAESSSDSYAIFGATPAQEAALRARVRLMHPEVLPLRIFFVPHWKYLDAARSSHLRVPVGFGSFMFTHLPSRIAFIDNDRYQGEEWLGHWIAHELGHLATNSVKEEDAEKAARELRRRLKDATYQESTLNQQRGSGRVVGNSSLKRCKGRFTPHCNQRQTRASLPRVSTILGIQYPHGSWLVTVPRPKSAAQPGAVASKL